MLHHQFLDPANEPEELFPSRDWREYRAIYGAEAVKQRQFYNVGAGKFRHQCWQTVDFLHERYADLQNDERPDIVYDLTDLSPLPIADASAWAVFTSHTIEHVRNDAVQNLYDECHRVLRPGGVARIQAPDFDLAYRAYRSGDLRYFRTFNMGRAAGNTSVITAKRHYHHRDNDLTMAFLRYFARQVAGLRTIGDETLIEHVARIFQEQSPTEAADYLTGLCDDDVHRANPAGHINWHNAEKIRTMLVKAGFSANLVYQSGFGQSSAVVMRNVRYFDRTRPGFSVYVEAIKEG